MIQPMMRPVLVFVTITYVLAIAVSLAVGVTGGHASPLIGLRFGTMFIPATAVLLLRAARNEGPRVDFACLAPRFIPVALLLMPGVLHATMLPVTSALEGGLPWRDWLHSRADNLYHTPDEFGWGALTFGELATRIAANAIVGLVLVSILACFEEIGWRAWLLPRLMDRIGVRGAVIASSAIWALWHVPFALAGIQHLDGVSPATTALLMPIGIVASGLILGWLWVRTRSFWIVALAHGALNDWGQYAFKYMHDFRIRDQIIVLAAGSLALLVTGSLLVMFTLPPTAHVARDARHR
jgi:membrane protease YdiL (CAAX protease family)